MLTRTAVSRVPVLLLALLLALVALAILAAACGSEEPQARTGYVVGHGMAPALEEGDSFQYRPADAVRVGDIVAFEFADSGGVTRMFIKRVVAVGGQLVEVTDGRVIVDDVPLDESAYVATAPPYTVAPLVVPEGHIYVLGDNRDDSIDSHDFGPVALAAVHGVVTVD